MKYTRQKNQIVRLEQTITKLSQFNTMVSQISINDKMSKSFIALTKVMTVMNETTNPMLLHKIMFQYQKQHTLMEANQEMIDEQRMLFYYNI